MTVARVEFRKQRRDGTWLIGLGMNRTQCRSTSDDFLVDPLLMRAEPRLRAPARAAAPGRSRAISSARTASSASCSRGGGSSSPRASGVGDFVAFPNTAGYLMHILESSSHQIPLARNLIVDGERAQLDPIDAGVESPASVSSVGDP